MMPRCDVMEWREQTTQLQCVKPNLIERTKTTSMEDVSTGVLEKNKEYLRSKYKTKKLYDVNQ